MRRPAPFIEPTYPLARRLVRGDHRPGRLVRAEPWQAVYAASKAHTRFLARALHEEERKRGVNVLLMSPGNMNTEMNMQGTSTGKLGRHPYLNLKRETARTFMMAERGHATYTPMLFYKLYRIFTKLMPSALAVKVTSFED
ncbi:MULTISPECIES: SDR family NAD(P)-dependent oxidoreductase [unclassified Bifidobacterium]|uniref:SDR family NAD(P)-dependent oxidoreductase n=1 Tax=unclassified Bifidobacterium TaxID=2608897 RepID=UPI001C613AF0|nr:MULTISPECIES: SDR family NAD(P)-dependent oxidoreductase [unclassified Bifidobacterium]